jgi:hypothetical protein
MSAGWNTQSSDETIRNLPMSHDVHNWGRHENDIFNFEKYYLVLQFSSRPKRVLTGRQAIHTVPTMPTRRDEYTFRTRWREFTHR